MNAAQIYSDAIGRKPKENPEIPNPALGESRELKARWLESTVTQEFFKSIADEIKRLETFATQAAVAYPVTNNHEQVIHALLRAETLRKEVIEKYGKQ
jgi:hypothetical protein